MGHDWENILGTSGLGIEDAFDSAASDELYLDHPRTTSGSGEWPEDPGDDDRKLPFDET